MVISVDTVQIIWSCERFTDPVLSLLNGSQTLQAMTTILNISPPVVAAAYFYSELLHHSNHYCLCLLPREVTCQPSFSLQGCEARALRTRPSLLHRAVLLLIQEL